MGGVVWSRPVASLGHESVVDSEAKATFIQPIAKGNNPKLNIKYSSHQNSRHSVPPSFTQSAATSPNPQKVAFEINYQEQAHQWKMPSSHATSPRSGQCHMSPLLDGTSFSDSIPMESFSRPASKQLDRLFTDIDLSMVLKLTLDAGASADSYYSRSKDIAIKL